MKILSLFFACAWAMFLAACSMGPPSAVAQQQRQQEQLEKESNMQVGMPAITQFSEKRELKQIYELRDREVPTITYIVDLYGKAHKLCDSVGFGIPYATEYTNPDLMAASPYGNHYYVMPQADPNGLYSPPDAEGTWVICLNPQTQKSAPLYVEPRIIVSQFPLPNAQ